jgi:hypothetical protein
VCQRLFFKGKSRPTSGLQNTCWLIAENVTYTIFPFTNIDFNKQSQFRSLGLFSSEAIRRAQRDEKMLGGSGNKKKMGD